MNKFELHNEYKDIDNKYNEIADGYVENKKSKFYSYIFNINNWSIQQIKDKIEEVKKDNKKAKHVLFAYEVIIDNIKYFKFNNDSEPQGTGMNSIISMIDKENVTNYLVIIVRYYGGILLGSGPLLRTYLSCFKEAYIKCNKKTTLFK